MAGSKSDYLSNAVLNEALGAVAYNAPATVYFGLYTDTNTATQHDAGTFTEPSGGAYARVPVTNNTTNFPSTSTKNKTCAIDVTFPQATASWGTANGWFIADAVTAGNILYWGDMTPLAIALNNIPKIPASTISITED